MELQDILNALRRNWWLPVVGLILGGVIGQAANMLLPPRYTADFQLFVSTTDSASTSEVLTGSQFSQQRVASYAELLTGEQLSRRVIDRLDLDMSPRVLAEDITADVVPNTVLLDVTVTTDGPAASRRIAHALGLEFRAMVQELETPDEDSTSPVKVTVIEPAREPGVPSEPNVLRNLALALGAGLALGGSAAVLRVRLDRSVRDPEDASGLAGAPVIGTIFRDQALLKGHVLERASTSRTAEDYRQLRTNLQFLRVDEPPKVIMVSSALPSEGKTTLTVNLAIALADAGRRVTVVEADLRRPRVTRYLGLVGGVGLTNVLAGTADLDEVLQPYGAAGMTIVAAGPIPPNPGELLASGQMGVLLDKLRAMNDFVLVDASPLLPVADSTALSAFVDGVILSVRYGVTHKDQLREAAVRLEHVHAGVLGLVLNIVPAKADASGSRRYGYGYEYVADPVSPT